MNNLVLGPLLLVTWYSNGQINQIALVSKNFRVFDLTILFYIDNLFTSNSSTTYLQVVTNLPCMLPHKTQFEASDLVADKTADVVTIPADNLDSNSRYHFTMTYA